MKVLRPLVVALTFSCLSAAAATFPSARPSSQPVQIPPIGPGPNVTP